MIFVYIAKDHVPTWHACTNGVKHLYIVTLILSLWTWWRWVKRSQLTNNFLHVGLSCYVGGGVEKWLHIELFYRCWVATRSFEDVKVSDKLEWIGGQKIVTKAHQQFVFGYNITIKAKLWLLMKSSWELNLGQKMSLPILAYDNFVKKYMKSVNKDKQFSSKTPCKNT